MKKSITNVLILLFIIFIESCSEKEADDSKEVLKTGRRPIDDKIEYLIKKKDDLDQKIKETARKIKEIDQITEDAIIENDEPTKNTIAVIKNELSEIDKTKIDIQKYISAINNVNSRKKASELITDIETIEDLLDEINVAIEKRSKKSIEAKWKEIAKKNKDLERKKEIINDKDLKGNITRTIRMVASKRERIDAWWKDILNIEKEGKDRKLDRKQLVEETEKDLVGFYKSITEVKQALTTLISEDAEYNILERTNYLMNAKNGINNIIKNRPLNVDETLLFIWRDSIKEIDNALYKRKNENSVANIIVVVVIGSVFLAPVLYLIRRNLYNRTNKEVKDAEPEEQLKKEEWVPETPDKTIDISERQPANEVLIGEKQKEEETRTVAEDKREEENKILIEYYKAEEQKNRQTQNSNLEDEITKIKSRVDALSKEITKRVEHETENKIREKELEEIRKENKNNVQQVVDYIGQIRSCYLDTLYNMVDKESLEEEIIPENEERFFDVRRKGIIDEVRNINHIISDVAEERKFYENVMYNSMTEYYDYIKEVERYKEIKEVVRSYRKKKIESVEGEVSAMLALLIFAQRKSIIKENVFRLADRINQKKTEYYRTKEMSIAFYDRYRKKNNSIIMKAIENIVSNMGYEMIIPAVGESMDPKISDIATTRRETSYQVGMVVDILLPGFRDEKGMVIEKAKVVVAD